MSYIVRSDIKDTILGNFNIQDYLEEVDAEVNDLADKLGVDSTLIVSPIHYKIKRYAICYALMRLCQDKLGSNSVEVADQERYVVKYDIYKKELQELRGDITYEMFTGEILERKDRVHSVRLYRG